MQIADADGLSMDFGLELLQQILVSNASHGHIIH
jgi:hypothetical protein